MTRREPKSRHGLNPDAAPTSRDLLDIYQEALNRRPSLRSQIRWRWRKWRRGRR